MMIISEEQLEQGLSMARKVVQCKNAIHCLWGPPKNIPEEPCPIVDFRKAFESNSPALFAKFLTLSEYQRVSHNFIGLQIEEGSYQQHRAAQIKFRDLSIFAQVSMVGLYPLYLVNGQIFPFISPQKIKEIEKDLKHSNLDRLGEKLIQVNSDWFYWIASVSTNFLNSKKYTRAIFLLIRLFIENTLPIQGFECERDKEKLFSDIKAYLAQK